MAHTAFDPAFARLIDPDAPVRQVASGFTFTEGPVWHPGEQALTFSDMPADVRRRWDRTGIRELMRPSNKANGLTYDAAMNLLACEHATSAVVRFRGGQREVLATHFEGRELNSPNDLCVHSSGAICFTDPWYGRMPVYGVERPRQLGFQGVYRLAPDHAPGDEPTLLVERYLFSQPNGICFSPCERRLFVNDTEQANIRVFDVADDGGLRNGRIFAAGLRESLNPGVPDGMKCDAEGNVWVTGPGGLCVFRHDGAPLGRIAIPELAANLAWGGEDWRTLFVCATTSLYAVRTKVGPRNEPFMRAGAARSARGGGEALKLEARRAALIIQDMQNDVVMEGGAFAASGSPQHCREQDAVANIARLAERCRALGVPVIHVWFVVPPGARGLTLNAPLFEGVIDANALVRGTWGAAPVPGLEPRPGDHIVEKMRMSAWEGTALETVLKAEGRDLIIETGAWTNMSIEHTARTGADKGYVMVIPEDGCSTMNGDWHRASINYALQNVALVTTTDAVIAALG